MVEIKIPVDKDEFNPISPRIPHWKHLGLLKWDATTITSRLNELLKKIADIIENYSTDFVSLTISNSNFDFDLVPRSFEAIFNANGWYGEIGLEYASSRLLTYSNVHTDPTSSSIVLPIATKFPSIINNLYNRKNWHQFGVMTWNDLLRHTFGTVNIDHAFSISAITFNFAKKELEDMHKKNSRLPRLSDSNLTNAIGKACIKGNFIDKDITSWNELLRMIFGVVNNDYNKYSGDDGFQNARKFLLLFQNKIGRIPTLKDQGMDSFIRPIKNGKWEDKGIKTWNDLLIEVYGEINQLSRNTYHGLEGLEYAKQFLLEFERKSQRIPTVNDSGMQSIASVAYSGEWRFQNISSWNELVSYVFGKNNSTIRRKYVGLKGLDEAAEFMRIFESNNNRLPRYKGDGMGSIVSAMHRGEWKEIGITKWNELLLTVFGRINVVMNKYLGKRGLKIAKREVSVFQKFHNRNPKTKDIGMSGISRAIWRGEWKEFGINSIQDLW